MKLIDNKLDSTCLSFDQYQDEYKKSISDPDKFWKNKAKSLDWIKDFSKVKESVFGEEVKIKWFSDGSLNASYNCLDRHLKDRGNKTAIIWESDDPSNSKKITYNQLHKEVCKFSNGLKAVGVSKGDRVTIYMPMVPEAAIAMLACSRIGAIHSVVFGGFAPESLRNRIEDCNSSVIITANEGVRGGKTVKLLSNVRKALDGYKELKKVIVLRRTESNEYFNEETDVWYDDLIKDQSEVCQIEEQNSEDPLFILYTSGSTGKPKGVLHSTAGYLLHASLSHKIIFNITKKNDYLFF